MFVIRVKIAPTYFVESKKRTMKPGFEQSKKKSIKVKSRLFSFQQI